MCWLFAFTCLLLPTNVKPPLLDFSKISKILGSEINYNSMPVFKSMADHANDAAAKKLAGSNYNIIYLIDESFQKYLPILIHLFKDKYHDHLEMLYS